MCVPNIKAHHLASLTALIMLIMALGQAQQWGNGVEIERQGDWYLGYGDNLWARGEWRECIPAPESWRCGQIIDLRAYRLPVYPVYLALLMPFAGDYTPLVARLTQAFMLAIMVWLAVHLAGRAIGGRGGLLASTVTGIGCIGFWSSYPQDGMQLLTEPLYGLLITATVYGMVCYPSRQWARAVGWGVLWGLISLTRGNVLFALPIFAVLSRRPIGFGVGVVLPIGLWTFRNWLVLGAFVPFSTGSGQVLLGTYNDITGGRWWDNAPNAAVSTLPELQMDAEGRRLAFEWLAKHPNPTELYIYKVLTSWVNPYSDTPIRAMGAHFIGAVLIAGLVGWIVRVVLRRWGLNLRSRDLLIATAALAVALTLNNIIFYSQYRFRQPLEPVLFAGGAVWLVTGFSVAGARSRTRRAGAIPADSPH